MISSRTREPLLKHNIPMAVPSSCTGEHMTCPSHWGVTGDGTARRTVSLVPMETAMSPAGASANQFLFD